MAEKKFGESYVSVMKGLKTRHFLPVYLLMGDESYYIDKITEYIANNVMPLEERDFNQSVLFGADVTAAQVVDSCKGYPLMAEYRVVIVKEAKNIRGWEPIEKYLEHPVKSTILVICHKNGTIDKRKKIVARASAVGCVFQSDKLRDRDLPVFIENYLRTRKTTIEPKATQMIADHVGADLNRLSSELEKVLISLPDENRRVTPEIVEREIGVSKEFNGLEMRSAVVKKDVYKVNQIMKYFDKNPKAGSIYAFMPLLFSYFQNLMIAYYAPQKNDEKELAKFLDLKSENAARDYMIGMRNYSGVKVMQIIDKFREIDAKSKGVDNSNTGSGELMKELLFFILH